MLQKQSGKLAIEGSWQFTQPLCCANGPASSTGRNTQRADRHKRQLLPHLEATGDGCTASTSMPIHFTSGARLMANMLRKALVEAYVTAKGLGMQALALLVYTKQPLRPSSICGAGGRSSTCNMSAKYHSWQRQQPSAGSAPDFASAIVAPTRSRDFKGPGLPPALNCPVSASSLGGQLCC